MNTMWCSNCAQDVPGRPTPDRGGYRCPRCRQLLGGGLALAPVAQPFAEQSRPASGPSAEQPCVKAQPLPEQERPAAGPSAEQARPAAMSASASGVFPRQAQTVAPEDRETAQPAAHRPAVPACKGSAPSPAYDSWELDEQLREVARRHLGSVQLGEQKAQARDLGARARVDQPHIAAQRPHSHSPQPHAASTRRRRSTRGRRRSNSLAGVAWLALSLGTSALSCWAGRWWPTARSCGQWACPWRCAVRWRCWWA